MGYVRASWIRRLAGVGLTAVAALATVSATALPAAADGQILGAGRPDAIKDSYLVVLKDSASPRAAAPATAQALVGQYGGKVNAVWQDALNGFAATMSERQARRLAADPRVVHVEQDATVQLTQTQPNPPSWGLDRIDQRNLPLDSSYTYPNTASNVTAYVIDTGIRVTHTTFGGRAVWGTNTVGDGINTDCHGHGTHVAGTIGGSQYGVAKAVSLVAVKVLNCSGSGSFTGIVSGVNWVTGNHVSGPAVANMSLGGSGSNATLENAVRSSIADGIVYAIASGNSNADACNFTPARTPEAITVNASTSTDARASFSNFGTCTDIFAPGQGITSAWSTSDTATNTISGTSMAAPHVAGGAALILSANPTMAPQTVASTMYTNATQGVITNPGAGSPNRLLFVGGTTPPPPGCAPATNGTNVNIPDYPGPAVSSSITISGCSGNASSAATVEVHIIHTWIGDLVVDLVAPDGSVYNLHNRSGGSADNIHTTYTRNLSGEVANGTWRLRARDWAGLDVGHIDSWTLDI
jgi:subtilisin family serine protease